MRKLITIKSINFKDSPRNREQLNDDAVKEYSEAYQKDEVLPPPLLYQTELHGLLVADGMHRLTALQSGGAKQTLCEVRVGSRADCFIAGVSGNLHHGVRRTSADKRQSVATAIAIYPELSDLKIAEICHVAHSTVVLGRKRLEKSGTIKQRETIQTTDGKSRCARNTPKPETEAPEDSGVLSSGSPDPVAVPEKGAHKGAAAVKPTLDKTGFPIPEPALKCWERADEVLRAVLELQALKRRLSNASEDRDALYTEVNLNAADCELESLINRLRLAVPYAVCPMCQGKLIASCTYCNHRGMVSQTRYDRTFDDIKKVRQEAVAKLCKP